MTVAEELTQESADKWMVKNAAEAMAAKLLVKRLEGRSGWHRPHECSMEELWGLLEREMKKENPDPVDVMNYAGMIYNRQERGRHLLELRSGYLGVGV